ncbi:protein FAR-RED IMPAIRED RESPONSE 1-like [Arachis hypogaea]|uniref:protein FAR-RED IMPAIRED RESPONSE 1-like n=1 Tax=Arachis hypogaea TaxID=3818 RepID=UPI000DED7153|nr:protein FAR-RED IMPAIRED RESPONSE 1-like [Arachis hypogaea]
MEFTSLQAAYDYYKNTVASRDSQSGGPRWVAEQSRGRRAKSFGRYLCARGKESETEITCSGKTGRWILDRSRGAGVKPGLRGQSQSHRVVKEGDLHQINSMRKFGMRVPTIFRAFANQLGGFETVGFEIKDIYNAIEKQRRAGATDAEAALKFLGTLKTTDSRMFWKYSLDVDNRLEHLFWCDGTSRYDYSVFRNVLGFDATYGRNKYKCPLVIFSGVDHHMRTVVFGCAILSNESEGSYVWLLRAFLEAMKGKQPKFVIMDGNLAMKSDLEVDEFERIWTDSVANHGLEYHSRIAEMYAKKYSWSNAHIWEKFFTRLKTTSKCEALNMQLENFIHNGI